MRKKCYDILKSTAYFPLNSTAYCAQISADPCTQNMDIPRSKQLLTDDEDDIVCNLLYKYNAWI